MNTLPIRLRRGDGFAVLTLCSPHTRNAVTPEFLEALHAHLDTLEADESLRCVLLQAEGPMFCVGADVKQMATHLHDPEAMVAHVDGLIRPAHAARLRLAGLKAPVVGLLRGTAAGGGASLALACDVLVAARSARLVFAYAQLGTTPDMGLSHALIQRLGPTKAFQLFVMSDGLSMAEAERLGLVQHVADDVDAQAAANDVVQRLTRLPAVAAKALFLRGEADLIAQRLERERESFLECARSRAFVERVQAFAGGHREP